MLVESGRLTNRCRCVDQSVKPNRSSVFFSVESSGRKSKCFGPVFIRLVWPVMLLSVKRLRTTGLRGSRVEPNTAICYVRGTFLCWLTHRSWLMSITRVSFMPLMLLTCLCPNTTEFAPCLTRLTQSILLYNYFRNGNFFYPRHTYYLSSLSNAHSHLFEYALLNIG